MSEQTPSYPYCGHDKGLVITQPRPGEFEERPMTPGELAARDPALAIARDIYRHANFAGVCYFEIWGLIARAVDAAITAAQAAQKKAEGERDKLTEVSMILWGEVNYDLLGARAKYARATLDLWWECHPHGSPDECPTYYDGCNCVNPEEVKKLASGEYVLVTKAAEQRAAEMEKWVVLMKGRADLTVDEWNAIDAALAAREGRNG